MDKKIIVKLFAENVRAERARCHYKQEKLAELAKISIEYLSKIENEKVCPSILVISKIAMALGVSLDTLLPLDKLK